MSIETQNRISKAKVKLILKGSNVFLSTLALNLSTIVEEGVGTAFTDGTTIKFDPKFVESLSDDELVFLVAHETWHVAFMHMFRRGPRDPQRWNCAADYVINNMLIAAGFTMIEGGLSDSRYKDMSAEEVYELLPENPQDLPENPQDGDFTEPSNGEGSGSSESKAEAQQKVQDAIMNAATAAQMQGDPGSVPGHIQRLLDEMFNPKLPWQVILANYMSAKTKAEKSWSRRNKRFKSVYLPSRLSESMGNVNIYVDASGSVSQDDFQAYITEMHDIRDSLKPELMKVVAFDTSIKEEFVMERGEEIDVSFQGGGGTCIEPVVAHAEQEETDVTIIFTDGYFGDVDYSRVPNDIVWIILGNPNWTCPVGKIIHMEV